MEKLGRFCSRLCARHGRKAIFFTLDALIASGILLIGLVLISSTHINRQPTVHLSYLSSDLIGTLSELKVGEIENDYVEQLIASGSIARLNNTIAEQIGEFWAEDSIGLAENLTMEIIGDSIPQNYGYAVLVNGESIHSRSTGLNNSLISSRKIISGYAKLRPVFGFTSKAFLTGIKSRKSSSIAYFGGFVGEGNITAKIELPQNITNITGVMLEALTGTDAKFYINGQYSGSFPKGSGNGSYIKPSTWNIEEQYWSSLHGGMNNFSVRFEQINENFTASGPKYIGGGYFKVSYITPDNKELGVSYAGGTASSKSWLPGIDGLVNLYTSIYVPGNLSSMSVYLDFESNYTTYLTIGGTTVYEAKANGSTIVNISNSQLASIFSSDGVSYSSMSMETIPVRLGLKNITKTGAMLDSVLVTDVSGSMDWRMDQDNVDGTVRQCSSSDLNLNSTQRLSVAKCAGKDFVDTILGTEGPLVGLASYQSSTSSTLWLTNSSEDLYDEIDSYNAEGGTCICCGVNSAVEMLKNDSQVMIVPRRASSWRYDDNDLSSDPSGWTSLGFSDSSWSQGRAALGNGYSGLNTVISKYEGYYYFRKKFNLTNASDISFARLYVYSDDGASIYINGNLVDNDILNTHTASYWNRQVNINTSILNDGENIIAAKVRNRRSCFFTWCWDTNVAFDLELAGSSTQLAESAKKKAMIVMTDGEANQECALQGTTGDLNNDGYSDTAKDDAIKAACDAYNEYGITVYTVGFGIGADDDTLEYMANCTDGAYFSSSNYEELKETYLIIANELITYSETQRFNQTITAETSLSPESFIEFSYTPEIPQMSYGEVTVTASGEIFGNTISKGSIFIPEGAVLSELSATSYSADKWTDTVFVENSAGKSGVFNLSDFGSFYRDLGDAFKVSIPTSIIIPEEQNNITVRTGISPANTTGGSEYNRLIYTLRIGGLLDYGGVFSYSEGCTWSLEFEDGTSGEVNVPLDYSGNQTCYYSNATYGEDDALDDAAYRLYSRLDLDSNGKLDIKLDENNLEADTISISDVPSLWGPAVVEVRIW